MPAKNGSVAFGIAQGRGPGRAMFRMPIALRDDLVAAGLEARLVAGFGFRPAKGPLDLDYRLTRSGQGRSLVGKSAEGGRR